MEAMEANLKAQFPNGKVCCYTCAMKFMNGSKSFVNFLQTTGYSVEMILAEYQPVPLTVTLYLLGIWKERTAKVCARILMDCHGPNPAPVVHRRYRQMDQLEIRYSDGDEVIKMGTVKMGEVFQIFKQDHNCSIAANVMQNLKNDFMALSDLPGHYTGLPYLKHDSYVSFNNQTGDIEVGYFRGDSRETKTIAKEGWEDLTEQDRCRHWLDGMRSTKRLSLLIVTNLKGCNNYPVNIERFLMVIKELIGSLDNFIVVFEIALADLKPKMRKDKTAARQHTIKNVQQEDLKRIKWLDTSPCLDTTPLDGEKGNHRDLVVKSYSN